jgi:integrase/recombinase XerD
MPTYPQGARTGVTTIVSQLVQSWKDEELVSLSLDHPLLDEYLAFVGARASRNTWLAVGYDLKVAFSVLDKEPADVTAKDVFRFITSQRAPRRSSKIVRIEDGEAGLSARTIKRRLTSLSGFYAYLIACGETAVQSNPVPRGIATRAARPRGRGVPLIRAPRTLPRILNPAEVNALLAALRTARDRAIVEAMLFGALRRSEALGLRLSDLRPGERRVSITAGKGGHARIVPISGRFFATVATYIETERPSEVGTDRLFLVLKQPRRGRPLSSAGLEEILDGARGRAGLDHVTCHELRHTCLTRLREAGMALEAVQAQAGHRSIESTRIYLHLANDWLAAEYRQAVEAIEAQEIGCGEGEGNKR